MFKMLINEGKYENKLLPCLLVYFIVVNFMPNTLAFADGSNGTKVSISPQIKNESVVQNKSLESKIIPSSSKRVPQSSSVVPVNIQTSTTKSPHHHHNASIAPEGIVVRNIPKINSGALLRGFYVFVGLSIIVVMYLVVRAVRLQRKVSRVHKYGILATREDVEMTPLGVDDEDDDTIVFDLSSHPPP